MAVYRLPKYIIRRVVSSVVNSSLVPRAASRLIASGNLKVDAAGFLWISVGFYVVFARFCGGCITVMRLGCFLRSGSG